VVRSMKMVVHPVLSLGPCMSIVTRFGPNMALNLFNCRQ
jgi:hypothetical protein